MYTYYWESPGQHEPCNRSTGVIPVVDISRTVRLNRCVRKSTPLEECGIHVAT